jgi:hypothetical protein
MRNKDTGESEEDAEVLARLEQALAAIKRVMTFAAIPTSWRAVEMVECGTPFQSSAAVQKSLSLSLFRVKMPRVHVSDTSHRRSNKAPLGPAPRVFTLCM